MSGPVSWPRRLWRSFYWRREDRRLRAEYPGVSHLVYFGGDGIGDELLLSAALHELRRRGGTGLGVMTRHPALFAGSPDVDAVFPLSHRDLTFLPRIGIRTSRAVYINEQRPPDIDVPPTRHILAEMCRLCGLDGTVELRPWLHLQPGERSRFASHAGAIVVQSSRRGASLAIGNKEWFPDRFQQVVDALLPRHRIVQIGQPADPVLRGAEDWRGKSTLRETASLLHQAAAFVGLVGFPMHLARAVDCPAVIVYGGRERPDQSGYVCNENLYTAVPCAPCWRWNSCDYDHRCMTDIRPQHVLAAVDRVLSRPRTGLAVERFTFGGQS
jgi:hypothetical protein